MVGATSLLSRRERLFKRMQGVVDFLKGVQENSAAVETKRKVISELISHFNCIQEEIIDFNQTVKTEDALPIDKIDAAFFELADAANTLCTALGSGSSEFEKKSQTEANTVALPKLKIPPFTGKIRDWQAFIELFDCSIHEATLPDIVKFQHLRSLVQGDALHLIENIPLTATNYKLAYETLSNRYKNNRLLASLQVNKLLLYQPRPLTTQESLLNFLAAHKDSMDAFNNLDITDKADFVLFQITYSHLDKTHQTSFDTKFSPTEIPKFSDLISHVEESLKYKELHQTQPQAKTSPSRPSMREVQSHATFTQASAIDKGNNCPICGNNHSLSFCPEYQAKSIAERKELVTSKKLCYNCLGWHLLTHCPSSKRCQACGNKHHSSLHSEAVMTPAATSLSVCTEPTQYTTRTSVLLATALVTLRNNDGYEITVRALLDQGSEISLISEDAVQRLNLRRRGANIPIKGIGGIPSGNTHGIVTVQVRPHFISTYECRLTAYILPKLTTRLPSTEVSDRLLTLKDLTLADPSFSKPGRIDILLGADIYGQLLLPEIHRPRNQLTAQNTHLGWIISGPVTDSRDNAVPAKENSIASLHCCLEQELHTLLRNFWEQERIKTPDSDKTRDPEEEECDSHFRSTHKRDSSGRYVVRLPFKRATSELGESKSNALHSLAGVQKKFTKNQEFKELYTSFLNEYEQLGHMQPVTSPIDLHTEVKPFYLPHHGVLKSSSSTTKLRVVFNGSAKTTSGSSLNDILHVGPKLQNNIADVLQWWRRFRYAFTADLEKMFRQIWVHEDDRNFQRILWSPNPSERPREYLLTTVTYGLASSPYLANRVLQQLAADEGHRFPYATPIISHGTYVDDLFGGADTILEARLAAQQLRDLGMAGGFSLHKWRTNNPKILEPSSNLKTATKITLFMPDSSPIRTLGITWDPSTDVFSFQPPASLSKPPYTKRTILSTIAQLFDPLGWIAPVVVKAKIVLQELWLSKIDWDDKPPENLCSKWETFIEQLQEIIYISVPRWTFQLQTSYIEIHGFADASEEALAAVIFIRVMDATHCVTVSLLQAKSKVAPLKRMTIPRLELSAAVLLVNQVAHMLRVLNLIHAPVHLWTDSAVTLTWIQGHPSKWKDFVCNRVSHIQEILPSAVWHHVPGTQNPADCATRGLSPRQLKEHQLWWSGPEWLRLPSSSWPADRPQAAETALEERSKTILQSVRSEDSNQAHQIWDLINRYSDIKKLLRVTALCRRFITKLTPSQRTKPISPSELHQERLFWTRLTQVSYFPEQIKLLSNSNSLHQSDSLSKLNPYLDEFGLLRVGGRLRNSILHPDQKHPLILPKGSQLTVLLIREAHEKTFHGGTQVTLSYLRQTYWLIGGRSTVKSAIRQCVRCTRYRSSHAKQLMGQLPTSRTLPSRPFQTTGVDYAGPIIIKAWKGRGGKTLKGYIVLFVCLATSAIHLELVTDYSVQGFLAAYRRFTSRRGICSTLYSDCGTNLVGANTELRNLFSSTSKELKHLSTLLANDGTDWKFNPPSAPHFGGKWESGVKSVKHHLRRVIGDTPLTFEELSTLLTQIEAVLNSRPLCPLSDDPEDLESLTPAHFLVGAPLSAVPEPELADLYTSHLQRWKLVQKLFQCFWKRWSSEYLQRFLVLPKWTSQSENIKVGTLVLLRDERYPPSKWPLGRITEVHPGKDGLVRVVTVKTKCSVLKRPIVKVCPLPIVS